MQEVDEKLTPKVHHTSSFLNLGMEDRVTGKKSKRIQISCNKKACLS